MLKFKEFLFENEKIKQFDNEQRSKKNQVNTTDIKTLEGKINTEKEEIKRKTEIINYVKSKFSSLVPKLKTLNGENEKSKLLKDSGVLDKQDIEKVNLYLQYEKEIKDSTDYIKHLTNELTKLKSKGL
jgi:RNA processing factor Prp31